jgi:hypothetical protein
MNNLGKVGSETYHPQIKVGIVKFLKKIIQTNVTYLILNNELILK